jgi:CHAT domain-containing protein/tetratricopeptide (TPR) repeat protein
MKMLIALSATILITQAISAPGRPELRPGFPIERKLGAGESQTYEITLAAGQYLQFLVDQRGISVEVIVIRPSGERLVELEDPIGTQGPRRVSVLADTSGTYRIQLNGAKDETLSGLYELRIEELRDGIEKDKERMAAQAAAAEGETLFEQDTAESLRGAIAKYTEARNAWRALGDSTREAVALHAAALATDFLGDRRQGLELYAQELQLWRAIGDPRGEALALVNMGTDQLALGETEKALESFSSALEIRRATSDPHEEAHVLFSLGRVHLRQGDYQKALEHYERAYDLRKAAGIRGEEADSLHELGVFHGTIGDYRKALSYYLRVLASDREMGNKRGEAATLTSIGIVSQSMGQHQEALEYYQQALTLRREVGDRIGEATTLHHIGGAYAAAAQPRKARPHYQEALAIERETADRPAEADTLAALAAVDLGEGDDEAALEAAQQALGLAHQTDSTELRWRAEAVLGRALRAGGRPREARAHLAAAIETIDSLRVGLLTDAGKIGFLEKRQAVFHELADLLHEEGRSAEALEVAEAGRSRAFVDLLAERQIAAKPADRARLTEIRHMEARLRAQARMNPAEDAARAGLARTRAATEADLAGRLRSLRDEQPELASLVAAAPVSFGEIAAAARRLGAPIVEYLVTDKRLLIWVVLPSGQVQTARVDVGRERLRRKVRDLHRQLNDVDLPALRNPGSVREPLAELYRWTLAPIVASLPRDPGSLVYLIPHDVLLLVPFGALVDERGRHVMESYTFASAPAAGVLRYTAEKKRRALSSERPRLLAIADPRVPPDAGVGDLPAARREVRQVSQRFPAGRRTVLVAAEASEANAKRLGPGQTLLHFAVHALVSDERPWESALILAAGEGEDGWLKASEAFALDLRADLVVLSGCSTGLGSMSGDGILGLARAFLYAGTPSVVVSQWDVSDVATAFLMDRFYAELASGRGKARALRAAQLQTWRRYPHPALWAAFSLVGEPQ